MEEVAKEAKFMREHTKKLEEAIINISTTSYSNLENTMEVINLLKDHVKELVVQTKQIANKVDCNVVTTRSGLTTKEPIRKDMKVDDREKEDIQDEDVIVEEIAREPIKTKSQLIQEAKQAIIREKLYPHKPTKQDKER